MKTCHPDKPHILLQDLLALKKKKKEERKPNMWINKNNTKYVKDHLDE